MKFYYRYVKKRNLRQKFFGFIKCHLFDIHSYHKETEELRKVFPLNNTSGCIHCGRTEFMIRRERANWEIPEVGSIIMLRRTFSRDLKGVLRPVEILDKGTLKDTLVCRSLDSTDQAVLAVDLNFVEWWRYATIDEIEQYG